MSFFDRFDRGFIGYPTASGMLPYWHFPDLSSLLREAFAGLWPDIPQALAAAGDYADVPEQVAQATDSCYATW